MPVCACLSAHMYVVRLCASIILCVCVCVLVSERERVYDILMCH